MTPETKKKIRAAILGASGYTGAELGRLLSAHPDVSIVAMSADSNAGHPISSLYPHFTSLHLSDFVKLDAIDFSDMDVAFCCLPHGTSQEIIAKLYTAHQKLVIIDLSADFRLHDPVAYAQWYGHPHRAAALQKNAVYGLTEIYRDAIRKARLIANPGCYPTTILLPLIPLLEAGVIDQAGIIADSKSGITGAGRSAKVENLFAEVNEDVRPYGLTGHRHVAEIEQELSLAAQENIQITFTPQVVPINRGMISNLYLKLKSPNTLDTVINILNKKYNNEQFVNIFSERICTPRKLLGTNYCDISVFADRVPGRITILSCIDNLTKGASGQAIQNMNVMFGFEESAGLKQVGIFP